MLNYIIVIHNTFPQQKLVMFDAELHTIIFFKIPSSPRCATKISLLQWGRCGCGQGRCPKAALRKKARREGGGTVRREEGEKVGR